MISAKQAQEKTEIGKSNSQIKDLEKKIKKSYDSGKSQCFTTEKLSKETLNELENAGYTVLEQIDRTKISW